MTAVIDAEPVIQTKTPPLNRIERPGEEDIVIAIADPSLYAQSIALNIAADQTSNTKWLNPIKPYVRTYKKEVEQRKILDRIHSTQDYFAVDDYVKSDDTIPDLPEDKKIIAKQNAYNAMFTRLYRRHLHLRAGEKEIDISDELKKQIEDFAKTYIQENHDDQSRMHARIQLRDILQHGLGKENITRQDIIMSNLTDRLDNIITKKANNPNYSPDIKIHAFRVKPGVRTTYDGTKLDKVLREKVYGTRWGAIVNPLVVATGVYLANYAITRTVFTFGGFVAAGIAGGVVAASREKFNMEQDKFSQHRSIALHRTIENAVKDKRRREISETLPLMNNAAEMNLFIWSKYHLLPFINNRNNGLIDPNFIDGFDNASLRKLALYRSLIDVSDSPELSGPTGKGYDLISYYSPLSVEWQRESIDQMLLSIENFLSTDSANFLSKADKIKADEVWESYKALVIEERTRLVDYIKELEEEYKKLERTNMAKAFGMAALSGIIGGALIRTGADLFSIANNHPTVTSTNGTFSSIYKTYLAPDGASAISSPVPISFRPTGNGIYSIALTENGKNILIPSAIQNGKISDTALKALQNAGIKINTSSIAEKVTANISEQQIQPPNDFLSANGIKEAIINQRHWIANNTPIPDGNETGLSVFNSGNDIVWHMNATTGGSMQNGISYNLPSLIQQGKVVDLLSYIDSKGIEHTYILPFDKAGNATLKTGSPLWKVFASGNGSNRAAFSEAATINGNTADVFATAPLPIGSTGVPSDIVSNVTSTITKETRIPLYSFGNAPKTSPITTPSFTNPLKIFTNIFTNPIFMSFIPLPRRNSGRMVHSNRIRFAGA